MKRVSESSPSMDHLPPAPNTREAPPQGPQPGPSGTGGLASRGAARARDEQPEGSRNVRPRQGDLQIQVQQTRMAPLDNLSPISFSPMRPSPNMTPAEKMLQAAEAVLGQQQDLLLQLRELVQSQPGPSRLMDLPLPPLHAMESIASAAGPRPSVLAGVPAADAAMVRHLRQAMTPPQATADQLKDVDARCMTLERLSIGLAASKVPGGLEALRQQTAGEQRQTILTGLQALAAQTPGAPPVNQHAVNLVSQAVQLMLNTTPPAPDANPQARPS